MKNGKSKPFQKRERGPFKGAGKPEGGRRGRDRDERSKPFGEKSYGDKPGDKRRDNEGGSRPSSYAERRAAQGGEKRSSPYGDKRPQRDDKRPAPQADKRREPGFEKRRDAQGASPRTTQGASPRIAGPLLWGFHAVRSAWLNPQRRVLRLLVTDAGLGGFQDTLDSGDLKRPQPELMDKGVFDRLMPPGAVHQGIAALVEPLPVRDAHDLVAGLDADEPAVLIILDQVTDPHNVGAILRSAAAFGAKGVILQDRHAPELTGVLAKTASGAADVIPVAVETNLSRAIEMLQENGFFVAGLDERGDALSKLPAHKRIALVLGAEGAGLRRLVADHCDTLVSLPTQGDIRSLNVSNAAAVALYAVLTASGGA